MCVSNRKITIREPCFIFTFGNRIWWI